MTMQRVTQMHNHRRPTDWDRMLDAARQMPLLPHHVPGRPFDILESDVAAWLCEQPEVTQFIFNYVKHHEALIYVDGRWVGAANYVKASAPRLSR
jgi:hypothetical protein